MLSVAFRHVRPAVIAALALCLIPVVTATQQPPPRGRVTITSAPSTEALRPPRKNASKPMVMAKPAFEVQSWFDRSSPPPELSPAPRGAIVLGRELRLENLRYTVDTPQLVIVVDKLRIGPNAVIDVSGQQLRASGGKISIIARQLTCESGGNLQLVSKGAAQSGPGGTVLVVAGTVEAAAGRSSGADGSRRLVGRGRGLSGRSAELLGIAGKTGAAAREGTLPPCVTANADGGPGATVEVRDHRRGRPPTYTRTMPPGSPGRIVASPLQAAVQADPFVQTAWSMWAVEWLETLQLNIYDASRTFNFQRTTQLLREYAAFDGPIELVAADMRERYRAVLEDLNSYRLTALPALSVEELIVRPGGLPQNVTVFTEGATLRASLAPTHALASRATLGGRSVLGMLEYRNERPDELAIEVEWELTVDPWSERLAAEQLTKTGQRLEGVFAGWSLETKPMQELGVRSAVATLLAGGRRLRVRFIVDAERANLVFWRLLNSAGIPWSVDWSFREPRTGRVVTGTWAGPPLTLVRQRQTSVTLADGGVVNSGSSPVTVNYMRTKDGSFVALEPALRVKPGETITLPAPVSAAGPVSIPPEGVETAFDPERFASDFYVINAEQVVDRVTVKNNLPTSDPLRGSFDRLEMTITASVEGDSPTAPVIAGPFVLSATGTKGGEITIPFLRLSRGTRRITIAGTAFYADGGLRTLKPTVFDTLAISITRDMFVE